MARRFRLWGKKRGDRRTGSRLLGNLGEATYFAALFLFGAVMGAALVTRQIARSSSEALYLTGWGLWLWIVVISLFLLIGGIGVVYSVLQVGASAERRSALAKRASGLDVRKTAVAKELPTVPLDANITNSPGITLKYRLPIAHSPVWRFVAATLCCVTLVGLASVLSVLAWDRYVAGESAWLMTFLAVPAVIASFWSIYYFGRQLLIYTSIGPTSVEISDHPLLPGLCYRVCVSQSGRMSMNRFELALVCKEEATYQQGTDLRTESRQVFEQQLFEQQEFTIDPSHPLEHETELAIPADAMHSFQSNSNAVHWSLVIRGDAERWPGFSRSFPIVIQPTSTQRGHHE